MLKYKDIRTQVQISTSWANLLFNFDNIIKKRKWLNTKLSLYVSFSKFLKVGYISRIINYDPKDIIPKIKCPTLSIYGENDYLVLAEKNAELLEEGLKKGDKYLCMFL